MDLVSILVLPITSSAPAAIRSGLQPGSGAAPAQPQFLTVTYQNHYQMSHKQTGFQALTH
jgi:hypothetical protein